MLRVYTLAKCSTCRAATKWLRAHQIAFEEIPIRDQPPSLSEVRAMADALGDSHRVFNTSGIEYRAQNLSAKMPQLSEDARLRLLAGNGSLVKRPFVIGHAVALVGFDEKRWSDAFRTAAG